MKKLFLLLFLVIPGIIAGQKTKLVKDEAKKEEFNVLKNDPSVMHGEYKKFSTKGKLEIHGYFRDGREDSTWSFYDSEGELEQIYDVLKKDVIFFRQNENDKYRTYRMITGSDTTNVILDRPPLFIGGNSSLAHEIMKRIRYPEEAINSGAKGRVYISFVIDQDGNIRDFKVLKPLGHGFDEEVIRVLSQLPPNWLPGIYEGHPVAAEYIYTATFNTAYIGTGNR